MKTLRYLLTLLLLVFALPVAVQAAMDEAAMQKELQGVLGDNSTWAITPLAGLKKDMAYQDARAVFPELPEADAAAKKIFVGKVKVEGSALVESYELKFRSGKLYGAIVNFKRSLDKELFKKVSLEVFEAKFGKVKAEKREKDTINKFNSDSQGAQRAWLVDHWLLELDIP